MVAVGVGRTGAVAAGCEARRQIAPVVVSWVTVHARCPASIESAAGLAPKPLPVMVSSVPPASEPTRGVTDVMRGGLLEQTPGNLLARSLLSGVRSRLARLPRSYRRPTDLRAAVVSRF